MNTSEHRRKKQIHCLLAVIKSNNFLDIFFSFEQINGDKDKEAVLVDVTTAMERLMSGNQAEGAASSSSPDLTSYDVVDEYPTVPSEPAATTQQQPSTHIPVSSGGLFAWVGGRVSDEGVWGTVDAERFVGEWMGQSC